MRPNIFSIVLIALLLTIIAKTDNIFSASPPDPQTFLFSLEYRYFNAYIVVPVRATETERYAADELAKYIKKITGAEISIIKEKSDLKYFGFYIGRTEKGKNYAPPEKLPYEGANGFRLKSVPNGLVIIGGDDLGTLYGVYAFLEEYQGCGWFIPYEICEIVPQNNEIYIPENLDVTQVPDIPIRWIGRGDWALKNRNNVKVQINGHDVGTINQWSYHTFYLIVPKRKYYEDHPEYYTLNSWERKDFEKKKSRICDGEPRGWQLCVSNPELVKLVTKVLVETLRQNPDAQFIYLTPNDGARYCQCSRCRSLVEPELADDPFGHETGPIFHFNNEVAKRVKNFCPDKYVKVGAYHVYSRYPTNPSFKLEDNIAVQVCHYDFCFNHPIENPNCSYNVDFMKDFSKWAKNTKHLHIYEYACLRMWSNLLWPIAHAIGKDMPSYHKYGTELFYTQTPAQTLSYALNYYTANKLAWDSSLDVDMLIKDFCKKVYGKSALKMERYHKFIEDNWENSGLHVSYAVEPVTISVYKFFPHEMITEADRLLREAEAVDADSLSKERVHMIRAEFDYLRLVLNYLEEISKPFIGIDTDNKSAMEEAKRQSASIGELLGANIIKYCRENLPENLMSGWERFVSRTHNRPTWIPGYPNKR